MLAPSFPEAAAEASQAATEDDRRSVLIRAVFAALDELGVVHCILHDYESFPEAPGADIDCIVDRRMPMEALAHAVNIAAKSAGGRVVRRRDGFFVLDLPVPPGRNRFVSLDFAANGLAAGIVYLHGDRILRGRRRINGLWIPSAAEAFNGLLMRTILKGAMDSKRAKRLLAIRADDPEGCDAVLAEGFPVPFREELRAALATGRPDPLMAGAPRWHRALSHQIGADRVMRRLPMAARTWAGRFARLLRPSGLHVVLLGPDGAGKSTIVDRLSAELIGPFERAEVRSFAPPLHWLVKRGPVRTDQPHALPKRSAAVSVARAGYWLLYDTVWYLPVFASMARGGLVLNDRHFIDVLVDTVRYRYGGPRWLLGAIRGVILQPHLTILLDAPAAVLHARKPEMTLEETERQCAAYRNLVRTIPHARIVDATMPLDRVVAAVGELIVDRRLDVRRR